MPTVILFALKAILRKIFVAQFVEWGVNRAAIYGLRYLAASTKNTLDDDFVEEAIKRLEGK